MSLGTVERSPRGTSWSPSPERKKPSGRRNLFYESSGMNPSKVKPRLLLFTAKLGYQTRAFDAAAKKLGVELVFVTDRCHQLDDPWHDRALPVRFEAPE